MPVAPHCHENRETLIESLTRLVAGDLRQAIDTRDHAVLLVSGGSTPAPLYRALSGVDLDWSRVHVALVDERWVPTDHAASNERLIRETLLCGAAAQARFTGMKNSAPTPQQGVDACNLDYASLPEPYTLCLLGMGADGHTASLFPRAQGLTTALQSDRYCAAIKAERSAVTGDFLDRMTLTAEAILKSERLVLLITGEDKWAALQSAEATTDTSLAPIRFFTRQPRPIEVYWAP